MDEPLAWHQALVYAVEGERRPDLGLQPRPDLDALTEALSADGTLEAIRTAAQRATARELPADLRAGLGAAQFAAALQQWRRRLDDRPRPVLSSRRPDAAEERLLRDVPPHHGS